MDSLIEMEDIALLHDNKSRHEMASQWLYDIKSQEEMTDGEIILSEYFDSEISKQTRKIVYPIYSLLILGAFVMVFFGVFGPGVSDLIAILVLCGMTWVGALVGMIGLYLWGTIEDCIEWFKSQNNKFADNVQILAETRERLKGIAKNVYLDVKQLQRHSKELSHHLEAFEDLRDSLQEICEDNQKLEDMLDEINAQYNDMVDLISQNERASLLSIYFEVSVLEDRRDGITKREWKRFLGRLNNKTKDLFLEIGDFDALDLDHSGTLDLEEFEKILDRVLERQHDLNLKHLMGDEPNEVNEPKGDAVLAMPDLTRRRR